MEAVADTTTTPETSSAPASPSTASAPVTSTAQTTASTPVAEGLTPNATQKDISDFLRKLDAPTPTALTPTIAAQPAGPTAQAAVDPTKAGDAKPYSAPPQEQWPTVLENARTKAVDGFRSQYGITPQITPEVFQTGIGFARAINENPIAFLNQLSANIANHPVWGPQLRSSAGRTLAQPAAQGPPGPDIEVTDATGRVVSMTFSDKRIAEREAWHQAQMKGEFTQMIQPFQQERDQRLQREQQDAFQKEVTAGAESELARVNKILEGRTELGPKVADLMAQGVNQIDAALQVREQFIVPTLTAAAEASVLDTQRKKAAGNTVNGSGAPTLKRTIGPNSTQKEIAAFLRESAEASA